MYIYNNRLYNIEFSFVILYIHFPIRVLHDLLIFTLRVDVERVRIAEVSNIESFANLFALDWLISLILIDFHISVHRQYILRVQPTRCNVT